MMFNYHDGVRGGRRGQVRLQLFRQRLGMGAAVFSVARLTWFLNARVEMAKIEPIPILQCVENIGQRRAARLWDFVVKNESRVRQRWAGLNGLQVEIDLIGGRSAHLFEAEDEVVSFSLGRYGSE